MIYKFRLKEVEPKHIIGTVFVHNNHSFKIVDITKTWGEAPILLGYIDATDESGNTTSFLIKCKKSFVDDIWDIVVDNIPNK